MRRWRCKDQRWEQAFEWPGRVSKGRRTAGSAPRENVQFAENVAPGISAIRTREDHKKSAEALQKAFQEIKALKDQLFEENLALRESKLQNGLSLPVIPCHTLGLHAEFSAIPEDS